MDTEKRRWLGILGFLLFRQMVVLKILNNGFHWSMSNTIHQQIWAVITFGLIISSLGVMVHMVRDLRNIIPHKIFLMISIVGVVSSMVINPSNLDKQSLVVNGCMDIIMGIGVAIWLCGTIIIVFWDAAYLQNQVEEHQHKKHKI